LFLDIPVLQCYSRYGEVISDLARFFRTERSNFPARLVTEQENNIGNASCSQKITLIGRYHILVCLPYYLPSCFFPCDNLWVAFGCRGMI
jgi:hypothetical protein